MTKYNIETIINVVAIILIIIILYKLIFGSRCDKQEHLSSTTNAMLSNEAIQNMSSLLNTGSGSLTNLNVTGSFKVGNLKANSDGSINMGGSTTIRPDGTISVGPSIVINNNGSINVGSSTVINNDGSIKFGQSSMINVDGSLKIKNTIISADGALSVDPNLHIRIGDTIITSKGVMTNNITVPTPYK